MAGSRNFPWVLAWFKLLTESGEDRRRTLERGNETAAASVNAARKKCPDLDDSIMCHPHIQ